MCSTPLRPQGITEDHVKLITFPFSLQGTTQKWLYYIEPNFVTSWNFMNKVFLEIFFSASRVALIKKEIWGIRHVHMESLAEY